MAAGMLEIVRDRAGCTRISRPLNTCVPRKIRLKTDNTTKFVIVRGSLFQKYPLH